MELSADHLVERGGRTPVLVGWPPQEGGHGGFLALGFVLSLRSGGILVAVPAAFIEEEALMALSTPQPEGEAALVGPFNVFGTSVTLENGMQEAVQALVMDLALPEARLLLAPVPHLGIPGEAMGFSDLEPERHPDLEDLLQQVREWLTAEMGQRGAFFSAEEDVPPVQAAPLPPKHGSSIPGGAGPRAAPKRATVATVSSQLESLLQIVNPLVQQVQALSRRQDELERAPAVMQQCAPDPVATPVRKAPGLGSVSALLGSPTAPISTLAKNLGPPPRTKPMGRPSHEETSMAVEGEEPLHDGLRAPMPSQDESPLAAALVEQSRALASLMVHLQHGSQDPLPELAGQSTGGLGVKGAAGREKLQRELASGSGQFYLRLSQAVSRRMSPTSPAPRDLKETASVSMVEYWERYGGYGQSRELGMIQWSLAHVYDAMAREDHGAMRDHLALTIAMVDQANQDGGSWQLAWLLRLLDDPPANLWINRASTATGSRRPFSPLVAQSWATVALAYLKETEILTNRKNEANSSRPTFAAAVEAEAKQKPKRKPWGGKGGQKGQGSGQAEQ